MSAIGSKLMVFECAFRPDWDRLGTPMTMEIDRALEAHRPVLDALADYDRMICSVEWCRYESRTAEEYDRHRQAHLDDPECGPYG